METITEDNESHSATCEAQFGCLFPATAKPGIFCKHFGAFRVFCQLCLFSFTCSLVGQIELSLRNFTGLCRRWNIHVLCLLAWHVWQETWDFHLFFILWAPAPAHKVDIFLSFPKIWRQHNCLPWWSMPRLDRKHILCNPTADTAHTFIRFCLVRSISCWLETELVSDLHASKF